MTDRSIQIFAHGMLNLYGVSVLDRIGQCIDDAVEHDEKYSFGFWTQIYGVIDEWQREEAGQTRH